MKSRPKKESVTHSPAATKEYPLPDGVKLTPMLCQFFEAKEKYPDCIVFFRMGDFYETFLEDAKIVAKELDITLTARDAGRKLPMAGVPWHSVDQYLAKMIDKGYKVAVCDQITQPDGKNLVEREVVKVVTPGTFLPEEGAQGSLASLLVKNDAWTLGILSPLSSYIQVGTFSPREAVSLLSSFSPKEILLPKGTKISELKNLGMDFTFSELPQGEFEPVSGYSRLCHHWNLATLDGFGINRQSPECGAASALMFYMQETSFAQAKHIQGLATLRSDQYLHLDLSTQHNLELFGNGYTLYGVLGKCLTPMGRRALQSWIARPLMNVQEINKRLDGVADLFDNVQTSMITERLLPSTGDVERSIARLNLKAANPRDLSVIRDTLEVYPEIYQALKGQCSYANLPDPSKFDELRTQLMSSLVEIPPKVVGNTPLIKNGYDKELDEWRKLELSSDQWLENFTDKERARTGISKLKVDYNKVFGYYIEISRAAQNQNVKIPEDYTRKQTLVNAERYITPELKDYETKRDQSQSQIFEIETKFFEQLKDLCISQTPLIQGLGESLARLDVLRCFAKVSRERKFCRPTFTDDRSLFIKEGRHPVVEVALQGGKPCIPNDLYMDDLNRIGIITGPNMAGKSTFLRMAAMIQIMAQMGCPVPATKAELPICDRIFTRIGARDELARGNSTFMVEMVETANILHNLSDDSLVILDEIGRGTSTYDGMAIAWSILEYLHDHTSCKAKTLFATHYHELTDIAQTHQDVFNLSMAVQELEDGVRFLHKVVEGPAGNSYGVEVATIAGLPRIVIMRARELLRSFEDTAKKRELNLTPSSQIKLFNPKNDALIEELATLDLDNTSPKQAFDKLYKLKDSALKILKDKN